MTSRERNKKTIALPTCRQLLRNKVAQWHSYDTDMKSKPKKHICDHVLRYTVSSYCFIRMQVYKNEHKLVTNSTRSYLNTKKRRQHNRQHCPRQARTPLSRHTVDFDSWSLMSLYSKPIEDQNGDAAKHSAVVTVKAYLLQRHFFSTKVNFLIILKTHTTFNLSKR